MLESASPPRNGEPRRQRPPPARERRSRPPDPLPTAAEVLQLLITEADQHGFAGLRIDAEFAELRARVSIGRAFLKEVRVGADPTWPSRTR